ncbi:helix-turn-helix domain-containing protein [Pedobacter xixiisoli]|uniref:Helicase n=1 Tax=Pedobacter xixiisoli TaxID=1476464 RepID=A0A286AEH4_9SPHI|nr:helix-turn-helix domain-containing protein [Pedobacter xixiisoli]SOD20299.1 Helicase [Pedobacter xixiisoli]
MEEHEHLQPAELAAKFVNQTSRHIFLTGKAGTGKTTFLRNIIARTHKKAVIVAPTGIAAINASGVTIHSLFQLPFGTFVPRITPDQNLPSGVPYNTPKSLVKHLSMNAIKRRILLDMELLVIDEVSMLRADLLDAIDFVLRYVRRNNEFFGGVQVLFIGDLYQLPPVVRNQEQEILGKFYQSAFFFDALCLKANPPIYIELDKIYRQADETFISLLNNLRNNVATEEDIALLKSHYQENYKPNLNDNYITLTTHNSKADGMNRSSLKELKGKSYFYNATVEKEFAESAYPIEKTLELKIGAQVMFIKNDPKGEQRFFNGKLAVVTDLRDDYIEVLPEGNKYPISLEQYAWKNIRYTTNKHTNEIEEEEIGTFTQYPLKLAWAITVHKSQGLTFDKAIVDIGDAFAPGQIYVALSRLRSIDGLILTSHLNNRGMKADQNVAYYSRTKDQQESLLTQITKEADAFLKQSLLQAFNFTLLDNFVYEHVFSYSKDEKRSVKQTHLAWAVKLQQELMAAKVHADKFLKQIDRLLVLGQTADLETLITRTEAASNYFTPILVAQSNAVFEHIEVVKEQKQTKEYLHELIDLEAMFYEQFKKIVRAKAMLGAKVEGVEISKDDLNQLYGLSKREEQMKKTYSLPNKEELERTGGEAKPRAKKKTEKEKTPKVDTKEVTLALFNEGKTPTEIAAERKMTKGTIEGHLAHYIVQNQISADKVIAKHKLEVLLKAIREIKSIKLNEIRDHVGKSFDFGEIKIAIAAFMAEGE